MKGYLLLFILTLSWLLGSCRALGNSLELPEPVTTSTPQVTQPPIPPTTSTLTPRPIATSRPTEITVRPSSTPAVIGTIVALSEPRIYSSHLSPDGKWQAEVVIHDCVPVGDADENAYEQLNLIQVGSDTAEIADSQLLSCGGLGAFGLEGLFWSPNSRYFYYTNAREGVPDGCGYWEPPFLRFDVTLLKSEYLGAGALSPDGTRLAAWREQDLLVWDVNAGEIARVQAFAAGIETGPVIWSPDSQSLVYVQVASYCPLSGASYVVRIDLPDSEQTLLLESETPSFGDASWDNLNELRLQDENGNGWRYDFTTKELRSE